MMHGIPTKPVKMSTTAKLVMTLSKGVLRLMLQMTLMTTKRLTEMATKAMIIRMTIKRTSKLVQDIVGNGKRKRSGLLLNIVIDEGKDSKLRNKLCFYIKSVKRLFGSKLRCYCSL